MKKIPNDQRVGITESSEVAFNLDCLNNLYNANIIISKRLTSKLIDALIANKEKIIFHCCVTGMGGTKIEPFVPSYEKTYEKLKELIQKGFSIEQVVLRIDPIVPTDKGIETASKVLSLFCPLGIKRVRISFLDQYKHVKKRLSEIGVSELYDGNFHAPLEDRIKGVNEIKKYADEFNFDLEVCGEPGIESIPCISQKDIDILGLTDVITLVGSAEQRKSCKCPSNKYELIKGKPNRCKNSCVYCFWR